MDEGRDSRETQRDKCVERKRTAGQARIAARAFQQSACSIVRHTRLGAILKRPQATAVPHRSLPAGFPGTRHEHRRTPPQPYFRPTEATGRKGRLIVFKVSDIMCHLADSRRMHQAKRWPSIVVSGRPAHTRPQLHLPTGRCAVTMLTAYLSRSTELYRSRSSLTHFIETRSVSEAVHYPLAYASSYVSGWIGSGITRLAQVRKQTPRESGMESLPGARRQRLARRRLSKPPPLGVSRARQSRR